MVPDNEEISFEFPGDVSKYPATRETPVGEVLFTIKKVTPSFTKPNTTGVTNPKTGQLKVGEKLAIKVLMVVSPGVSGQEDHAGTMHNEDFYIGSDEDPKALKPGTWHRNATRFFEMVDKAGVARTPSTKPSQLFAALAEQQVGCRVRIEKSNDPQYSDKRKIRGYFKPGTVPVKITNLDAELDTAIPAGVADTSKFSGQD